MKRRILGIIIPVLAGVTIVGTGFSVWYFTDNTGKTATTSVNVNLSGYAEIASITIPNTANYTLDLDSSTDTGIHLNNSTASATADQISDVTVNLNANALNGETLERDLTVTATIKFTGGLDSYVSFVLDNGPVSSWTGTTGTFTTTIDTARVTTTTTLNVPDLALTFSWKDEPTTVDEWNDLNTVVKGSSLDITYTVAWAA